MCVCVCVCGCVRACVRVCVCVCVFPSALLQISELEHEIEVEKTTAHNIVSSMSEEMRDTYQSLQRTNKKQMEL